MNLFDAFKTGGLPGLGAAIGANSAPQMSKETKDAIFKGNTTSAGGLGAFDKTLILIGAVVLGAVIVARVTR